jgi:hypothetical protein
MIRSLSSRHLRAQGHPRFVARLVEIGIAKLTVRDNLRANLNYWDFDLVATWL